MNDVDCGQLAQDEEYRFPYHYVSNMPDAGFAQHFVDTWGVNYISTIEFLLSKIAECAPQSIVDIGCGDGRLAREIHLKLPSARVKGLDYSSRAINLAKAMNADVSGVDYEQIDIARAELSDLYDVAVLMEVFEHIPLDEAEGFLSGVSRVIRPGGVLLLTVPHANKPVEYKHFQHFTINSISRYLNPLFDIAQVVPFEKRSPARQFMNRILCNRLFVLNNPRLLNLLYEAHQKYLFYCSSEQHCQRLFVKAIAK